jgi:hypothetical protein
MPLKLVNRVQVELYCERLHDLFVPACGELTIQRDDVRGIHVAGAHVQQARTALDMQAIIDAGLQHRVRHLNPPRSPRMHAPMHLNRSATSMGVMVACTSCQTATSCIAKLWQSLLGLESDHRACDCRLCAALE